jgi:TRAP-type C4-dicarboxylate transport system permease small subunit
METQSPDTQPPGAHPPDPKSPEVRPTGSDTGILGGLDRYIAVLSRVLFAIAGIGLVGMLALVVADIIGIKIFSSPVPGGIEIVSFLAVVAIGFALPYTQFVNGNVAVDFVIEKVPPRPKSIIDAFTVFLGLCLMVVLAYYSFKYAGKLRTTGEVSMTQKIPFYPFVYGLAFCFVVTALVLIAQVAKTVAEAVKIWTR